MNLVQYYVLPYSNLSFSAKSKNERAKKVREKKLRAKQRIREVTQHPNFIKLFTTQLTNLWGQHRLSRLIPCPPVNPCIQAPHNIMLSAEYNLIDNKFALTGNYQAAYDKTYAGVMACSQDRTKLPKQILAGNSQEIKALLRDTKAMLPEQILESEKKRFTVLAAHELSHFNACVQVGIANHLSPQQTRKKMLKELATDPFAFIARLQQLPPNPDLAGYVEKLLPYLQLIKKTDMKAHAAEQCASTTNNQQESQNTIPQEPPPQTAESYLLEHTLQLYRGFIQPYRLATYQNIQNIDPHKLLALGYNSKQYQTFYAQPKDAQREALKTARIVLSHRRANGGELVLNEMQRTALHIAQHNKAIRRLACDSGRQADIHDRDYRYVFSFDELQARKDEYKRGLTLHNASSKTHARTVKEQRENTLNTQAYNLLRRALIQFIRSGNIPLPASYTLPPEHLCKLDAEIRPAYDKLITDFTDALAKAEETRYLDHFKYGLLPRARTSTSTV